MKNLLKALNDEFLGLVYTLLIMGAIQAGDADSVKQYWYQALEYQSSTNISILVPHLLEVNHH